MAMTIGLAAAPAMAVDADHGATLFKRCAICHAVEAGKRAAIGPNLWGVVGRKAGDSDFAYSPALKSSGIIWTADTLDSFLLKPSAKVPGNRMTFGGIADAAERGDIIAYLATLK